MALKRNQKNRQRGGQNAGPGQHNPLSPGRIITSEHPVHLPDGSTRVFREVVVTVKDNQGVYRTEETQELAPPLDCGCQPSDENDLY